MINKNFNYKGLGSIMINDYLAKYIMDPSIITEGLTLEQSSLCIYDGSDFKSNLNCYACKIYTMKITQCYKLCHCACKGPICLIHFFLVWSKRIALMCNIIWKMGNTMKATGTLACMCCMLSASLIIAYFHLTMSDWSYSGDKCHISNT